MTLLKQSRRLIPAVFAPALTAGLSLGAADTSDASTLFLDTFSDDNLGTATTPGDIIGGFTGFVSGGTRTVADSGGNLVMDHTTGGGGNFENVGAISNNAFNGAANAASGLSWTTTISSMNFDGGDARDRGLGAILTSNSGNPDPIGGNNFSNVGTKHGLYFRVDRESGEFRLESVNAAGDVHNQLHSDTSVTKSELADGYTVTVTADTTGWSLAFTGAASLENVSGTWGSNGYSDIFASNTYVGFNLRDGVGRDSVAEIDSVQVSVIPEPSSLALIGMGGAMMMRRRRA